MTPKLLAAAIGLLTLAGLALAQALAPTEEPAPTDQPAEAVSIGAAETPRLTLGHATAPAVDGDLQRMVVTGYIIPRLGDGTQPVFTLDRDWWQRRGQQNVAQVLETLPFSGAILTRPFRQGTTLRRVATPSTCVTSG